MQIAEILSSLLEKGIHIEFSNSNDDLNNDYIIKLETRVGTNPLKVINVSIPIEKHYFSNDEMLEKLLDLADSIINHEIKLKDPKN